MTRTLAEVALEASTCTRCKLSGMGRTQVVFGVEGVIDELARKIGMDPIDLRLKNAATEGW